MKQVALEHLPYEEGIKTIPATRSRKSSCLEHLPYEEGIKTLPHLLYHMRRWLGTPTL